METRHIKTTIGWGNVAAMDAAMDAAMVPAFGMTMMPTSAATICPCNLRYFL
ncbi:hypothetical protein CBM2637_B130203 [Cupriavidus taiwanensis]|uniref:hypothetical protein n=1 Tax=Cupriavidus taiwanensis TaxID=164546 RepID=UPI000E12290A|nr:hypothetical protein [Cupriavidus taiwanensis]SPA32887.1 hypothetical protein CBM2637_B130203 [Cupriavidus taiwanensis]